MCGLVLLSLCLHVCQLRTIIITFVTEIITQLIEGMDKTKGEEHDDQECPGDTPLALDSLNIL